MTWRAASFTCRACCQYAQVGCAAGQRWAVMPVTVRTSEYIVSEGRGIAEELEQQHPQWIVIFGAFTREFVCLPRFAAPPGLKVVAFYPKAAAERMAEVERLSKVREGLLKTGERTDE